ncbi:MAG TPA: hypothetical protein PK074_11185 [Spirochaetales bacterium]|nr:hypothetical protein [Spirochaetales bacterium]
MKQYDNDTEAFGANALRAFFLHWRWSYAKKTQAPVQLFRLCGADGRKILQETQKGNGRKIQQI